MSEDLYLYPEEFTVDPSYRTRLWPNSSEDVERETKAINELSRSIGCIGQLEPAIAMSDPGGRTAPILIVGHRRRRAIAELNTSSGVEPRRLWCRLEAPADPLRLAAISNLYSRSFSPMEIAAIITHVNQTKPDAYQIPDLAAYFGLSWVQIGEYQRLITELDPDTQMALHSGKLTLDLATDYVRAIESKRDATLKLAQTIQRQAIDQPKPADRQLQNRLHSISHKYEPETVLKKLKKKKPPIKTMVDVKQFFVDILNNSELGYIDGDMKVFAERFLAWTMNRRSPEMILADIKRIVEHGYKGTEEAQIAYDNNPYRVRAMAVVARKREAKLNQLKLKENV